MIDPADDLEQIRVESTRKTVIELRKRLLDLSNRNRLLNYRHTASAKQLRIVNTTLECILSRLSGTASTRFASIPEDEGPDPAVEAAFDRARLVDEDYLAAIGAAEDGSDEAAILAAEEALFKKVSLEVGTSLLPRTRSTPIDMAVALGIDPSFDLLIDGSENSVFQGLLFAGPLERKLSSIRDEAVSSLQERGVPTMYCAIAFLEWFESDTSSRVIHSPLLLVPLEIDRRVEQLHYAYFAKALDEDVEVDVTLHERLYADFRIKLPEYDPDRPLSEYLREIEIGIATHKRWKIRTFATVGLFNFTRLAMYRDLDPAKRTAEAALENHPILKDILGGSTGRTTVDGDHGSSNDAHHPNSPLLITDADSSQFAAIFESLSGSSFVIEGPPGTGKSQTITNMIGALLYAGKTVLFLADKLAALEVVKARLDVANLGEFCMELHSTKIQKSAVYASLKKRRDATIQSNVLVDVLPEINAKKAIIERYTDELHNPQGAIGQTLFDLLWRAQALRLRLGSVESALHTLDIASADRITPAALADLKLLAKSLAEHVRKYNVSFGSLRFHPLASIATTILNPSNTGRLRDALTAIEMCAKRLPQIFTDLGLSDDEITYGQAKAVNFAIVAIQELSPRPLSSDVQQIRTSTQLDELVRFAQDRLELEQRRAKWPTSVFDQARLHNAAFTRLIDVLRAQNFTTYEDLKRALQREKNYAVKLDGAAALLAQLPPLSKKDVLADISCLVALVVALQTRRPIDLLDCPGTALRVPGVDVVDALSRDIAELNATFADLNSKYDVSLLPAPTALRGYAATLREVSFFAALFSSRVRETRRFYNRIALSRETMSTSILAERFVSIAQTLESRAAFEVNETRRMQFGSNFRGFATDLALLRRLSEVGELLRLVLAAHDTAGPRLDTIIVMLRPDELVTLRDAYKTSDLDLLNEICGSDRADLSLSHLINRTAHRVDFYQKLLLEFDPLQVPLEATVADLVEVRDAAATAVKITEQIDADDERSAYLGDAHSVEILRGKLTAIASVRVIRSAGLVESFSGICPVALANAVASSDLSCVLKELADAFPELEASAFVDLKSFAHGELDETALSDVAGYARQMLSHFSGIPDWLTYVTLRNRAQEAGLDAVLKAIGDSALADLAVEYVIVRSLIARNGSLRINALEMDGSQVKHARDAFQQLDRRLLIANREKLRGILLKRYVEPGNKVGRRGLWTDNALIDNEALKSTRFISLRDLHARAHIALQQLKPCYMMSPLSVAQYLDPNTMQFDVLIVDEASQMRPEDALGAISRARQMIIVGDPKQLPPTAFFDRSDGSNDEVADEDVVETESILDLALQQYARPRRLLWHYRSRHDSLIAFSNKNFYEGELLVFPSPDQSGELGVRSNFVSGIYQVGASTNMIEAGRIADAAVEHMKNRPHESLGLVAMNQKQRDLIRLEVDRRIVLERYAQKYVEKWEDTAEPFIVKNLESIQGDERDNIFISTVYGPDRDGNVYQRFGPVNSRVGWRRLNVLFTRAKLRVELFTSLRPQDVLSDERSGRGVRALHDYLDYASSGRLEIGAVSTREPESDFEVAVADMLRNRGYECVPQVGVAGFFIDIGVRDPNNSGRFILGIECDGKSYHSSKSARDRDRLRDEVLTRLGWPLHRIWSTDWFADPARELDRAIDAINAAVPKEEEQSQAESSLISTPESVPSLALSRLFLESEFPVDSVKPAKDDELLIGSSILEAIRGILPSGTSLEREKLLNSLATRLKLPLTRKARSVYNKTINREVQGGRLLVDSSWSIVTRP